LFVCRTRRRCDAPERERQASPIRSRPKRFWRYSSYALSPRSIQLVFVSALNGHFDLFGRFACDDLVFEDLAVGRQFRTLDLVIVLPESRTDQGLTAMEKRFTNCDDEYGPWLFAVPLPAFQQFAACADFGRPARAQRFVDARNQE